MWRLMHLSRNPLVRGVDRWEVMLSTVIMVCAISLLPFGFAVGEMAYSDAASTTQRERSERELVQALITESPVSEAKSVSATWRASGGRTVNGDIDSYSSDHMGSRRAIWTDRQGHVTERPQPMGAAWVQGILAGLGVAAAIVAAAAGSIFGLRRILDRGRHQAWSDEWQLTRLDATS